MFEYYQALGLEPKLALDRDELRKRFYERSRETHPDLVGSASAGAGAEDRMAQLNDAFRTLRNPIQRAEYFLGERGIQFSKDVPPELLEEVFELNMALEELRGGDESARGQLDAAQENFAAMIKASDAELQTRFAAYDAAPDREKLAQIRALLSRRKYIQNLLDEVQTALPS